MAYNSYSFYAPPQWQLQWNFLGQTITYQPQLTNIHAPVWTLPNPLPNFSMPAMASSGVPVTLPGPVNLAPGTSWAYSIPTAPSAPTSSYAYSLPVTPPVAGTQLPDFNVFSRLYPTLPVIPQGPPPPLPTAPAAAPPPSAMFPQAPVYSVYSSGPLFDVLAGIPMPVA